MVKFVLFVLLFPKFILRNFESFLDTVCYYTDGLVIPFLDSLLVMKDVLNFCCWFSTMVQVLRANVNGMLSHNDSDELDEKGRQSRVSRPKTVPK